MTPLPPLRAAVPLALFAFVFVALMALGATFHRPAWAILGVLLAAFFAIQSLRDVMPRAWAALLSIVDGPVLVATLVGLTDSFWTWKTSAIAGLVALTVSVALARLANLTRTAATLILGWQILLAAPIDLALVSVPNGPRVLPLQMGLLSEQGIDAAKRGEFVSGGCVVSGLEPQWVLAW